MDGSPIRGASFLHCRSLIDSRSRCGFLASDEAVEYLAAVSFVYRRDRTWIAWARGLEARQRQPRSRRQNRETFTRQNGNRQPPADNMERGGKSGADSSLGNWPRGL